VVGCSLTKLSVSFIVDIPLSEKESFFQGKPCVVLKDKVSQPSSPLRHATELFRILEKENHKPILIMVSDGGPDHRITFPSVKLSLVALFQVLDLVDSSLHLSLSELDKLG